MLKLDELSNRLPAGAPYDDNNSLESCGSFSVFQNINGVWTQLGDKVYGNGQGDELGARVDISGNGHTVAAGAPYDDDGGGNRSGSVHISKYSNGSWSTPTIIHGENPDEEMGRGVSISYNGNVLALGGTEFHIQNSGGIVRVYEYSNSSWSKTLTLDGELSNDRYGDPVSLSYNGSVLASASFAGGENDAGYVEVYSTGLVDTIDNTSPTLTETTPVSSPTNDNTPNVVITSDEAGSITCSLGFSTTTTGTASANTITFNELSDGTYNGETVTFTDSAGNSTTITLTTFIVDTTPPTFTTSPSNISVDCGSSTDPSATGTAIATDAIDSDVTVTYSDTTAAGSGNSSVITRIWTATDDAGNSSTYTQTVSVTDISIPSGDSTQSFCDGALISDLVVTGQNIQFYDAATAGNLLDNSSNLSNGQIVYASQTINSCESENRLAITIAVHIPEISSTNTSICSGDSLVLTADSNLSAFTNWNTDEPNNVNGEEVYGMIMGNGKWNDHNPSYSNADFIMESSTEYFHQSLINLKQ